MYVTPSSDVEEEDGELREVNGVGQLRGYLKAAPAEQFG